LTKLMFKFRKHPKLTCQVLTWPSCLKLKRSNKKKSQVGNKLLHLRQTLSKEGYDLYHHKLSVQKMH
jgi:hypothetical protein